LGTAAYLAPEQARGGEAAPRADLYALGVVTYQLISGRLPYEAASLTELALKQQQEEPAMLDTLVAAVTPELAEAVALALALDPRERYESAREMGRAISDGALGISPNEHRGPTRGTRHATESTSVLASATRTHSPSEGRGAVAPRQPRRRPAARHRTRPGGVECPRERHTHTQSLRSTRSRRPAPATPRAGARGSTSR